MKPAPIPENEKERLESLREHQLLDTMPEEVYDDITKLATEICGTPIALLTLIDENRQWFKSKQGLVKIGETPREHSFCAHAIINPNEAMVVEDARYDERFHDNPLTTGEPQVVFYAGVPVKDASGNALGSLCVIDSRPRELPEQKLESLKALAKLVNCHFELRKKNIQLSETRSKLEQLSSSIAALQNNMGASTESHALSEQLGLIDQIKKDLNDYTSTNLSPETGK